jgi:hypothetical protein
MHLKARFLLKGINMTSDVYYKTVFNFFPTTYFVYIHSHIVACTAVDMQ